MQPLVHLFFIIRHRILTRVRAGEVGVAHYPKWRRSLLIHAETRDFHSSETWNGSKNDRLGSMHTSDQKLAASHLPSRL